MTRFLTPLLLLALLATFALSLCIGSSSVAAFTGLMDFIQDKSTLNALVIGEVRLPRTLLAMAVGAALGLSGAALQGLLRNPLAEPSLTGASQGAALGAAMVFYFGLFPSLGAVAPSIAGLIGAALALMLMLLLAGSARSHMVIMAGLAVSTLSTAALATALNFAPSPYALQELVFWLLGSVSERSLEHFWLLLPALAIGSLLILSQRRLLSGLSLGDDVARSMGLNYQQGSIFIVLGAAILVGSSVAVAGSIGFVGLVVPHLVRPLVNHRPDHLLFPAALAGAILVCLADIGVRVLPVERELKLGVLTSILGAPLFIWLVWKERKRWM